MLYHVSVTHKTIVQVVNSSQMNQIVRVVIQPVKRVQWMIAVRLLSPDVRLARRIIILARLKTMGHASTIVAVWMPRWFVLTPAGHVLKTGPTATYIQGDESSCCEAVLGCKTFRVKL